MSGGRVEPVKVVIINTEYVETDATSFKSVVQKLTGKDSRVAADCSGSGYGDGQSGRGLALMRDVSFKEFGRLLKEIPKVDEYCEFID
ncbi:hypothetical protein SLE2022_340620 [Rubroshorea leprosula]